MEARGNDRIKLAENINRRLGYAQEFKDLIHEHPGILRTALQLTQKAEDKYNPGNIQVGLGELEWNAAETRFDLIKFNGEDTRRKPYQAFIWGRGVVLAPGETLRDEKTHLEVTALAKTKREFRYGLFGEGVVGRIDRSSYFKVRLDNKSFFVKKSTATDNPGYEEFKASNKAAAALRGIEDLGVVEAQLGYDDNHQSWFVSRWEDLESSGFFPFDAWVAGTPNDYGQFLQRDKDEDDWRKSSAELSKVLKKGEATKAQIETKFAEAGIKMFDLDTNLFYNPQTDKYFLLDITPADQEKVLDQPRERPLHIKSIPKQ